MKTENGISAVCHPWLKKLSLQQSRQNTKYCLLSVGHLGLGQNLNVKCGQAFASASSEIEMNAVVGSIPPQSPGAGSDHE